MSELKQLTEELLKKFSISNFLNISPDDAQGNKNFFSNLGIQVAKIEVLIERSLREGKYQAIAEASPLSVLLGYQRNALYMLKDKVDKEAPEVDEKDLDVDECTNALIKAMDTFHHYLVDKPDELSIYHLLKGYSSNRLVVEQLYDAHLKGSTIPFHFSKSRIDVEGGFLDLLEIFEENSNRHGLFQFLTRQSLNEFQTHKDDAVALEKAKQNFYSHLENLAGYKSYVVKNFVLSGPPSRHQGPTNAINVNYKKNITDFQMALDGVENFTASSYLAMLNVLDEHNKSEKYQLSKDGVAYVNYFGQNHELMHPKNLISIRKLEVPLDNNKGFIECLKDTLKHSLPIEDACSIIAHQQGEFEVDGKKVMVQQHDALSSLIHDHMIINAFEKDKLLGVYKEVKRDIQTISPIAMAHPFGGLDETKPVIEQITPHMQKMLTVGFLPSFKDIFEPPNLKAISKFFKAPECKVVAENFKKLVDNGLSLNIYKTPNDIHDDRVNMAGTSLFFFNYAEMFSPNVAKPELTKEFVKKGLAKGFVDALNKFSDILWHSDAGVIKEMSPTSFKKLVNLSVVEATKGKADGIEEFLSATTKLYAQLDNILHYIDPKKKGRVPLAERYAFTQSFCSDVYEVFSGMNPTDLQDKNGTSPLIRLIKELNRLKTETAASSPIFVKDEQGKCQMVGHAIREKDTLEAIHKAEKSMFSHFSPMAAHHVPLVNHIYEVRRISTKAGEFINLGVPRKFFDGQENIQALIQGKDEQGNNILHHLLQNPYLFYSSKDRVNEENIEYTIGKKHNSEYWHNSTITGLSELFMVKGAHIDGLSENYSNIEHFVKQIPREDIKRLALEKNNAGRTPFEELCYFAEFVKERAQTSFSISKAYNDLLDSVMDINGIDTSSKLEVLRKPPEFLNAKLNKVSEVGKENDDINRDDTKPLVAEVVQENVGNILRYLYSLNSISEQYDFKTTINTSNISTPSLEYKIMKGDGTVKKAMSKLPL